MPIILGFFSVIIAYGIIKLSEIADELSGIRKAVEKWNDRLDKSPFGHENS